MSAEELEQLAAARAYLAARAALVGAASGPELAVALLEVDWTLHQLHHAYGMAAPGCWCDDCGRRRTLQDGQL